LAQGKFRLNLSFFGTDPPPCPFKQSEIRVGLPLAE